MQFVEYNQLKKVFHVTETEDAIKTNLKNVVEQQSLDWVPVGIFEDTNQACEFIEHLVKKYPHLKA